MKLTKVMTLALVGVFALTQCKKTDDVKAPQSQTSLTTTTTSAEVVAKSTGNTMEAQVAALPEYAVFFNVLLAPAQGMEATMMALPPEDRADFLATASDLGGVTAEYNPAFWNHIGLDAYIITEDNFQEILDSYLSLHDVPLFSDYTDEEIFGIVSSTIGSRAPGSPPWNQEGPLPHLSDAENLQRCYDQADYSFLQAAANCAFNASFNPVSQIYSLEGCLVHQMIIRGAKRLECYNKWG